MPREVTKGDRGSSKTSPRWREGTWGERGKSRAKGKYLVRPEPSPGTLGQGPQAGRAGVEFGDCFSHPFTYRDSSPPRGSGGRATGREGECAVIRDTALPNPEAPERRQEAGGHNGSHQEGKGPARTCSPAPSCQPPAWWGRGGGRRGPPSALCGGVAAWGGASCGSLPNPRLLWGRGGDPHLGHTPTRMPSNYLRLSILCWFRENRKQT